MRRLMGVLLLAGTAIVLLAVPAQAHALVRKSDPASGAILTQPPAQVTITFTEPPDPGLAVIHVIDSNGRDVERGRPQPVPGSPLELRVPLSKLPNGVYTVTWRVVSRADGHVTAGSFSFGVGVSPVGAPTPSGAMSPTTPSPTAAAVAGRWAFYWGLALLVGGGVFGSLIAGGVPRGGRLLLVAAWALSLAGLVTMTLAERSAVGVSLGRLLGSQAGRELIRRAVALAVAGVAVAVAFAIARRASMALVAAAGAAVMLVHVLAGHAGAETRTVSRWFDTGTQWLHIVAVGVWVGGLAWLLLSLRGKEGSDRSRIARRFSFVAGIALAAVALTGTIRAINELGGKHLLHGLLHTSFGLALVVKVGLFACLVALGARNRYVNVPGLTSGTRPSGSLRRTVGAEILIAAGILGATGVLSELPPATVIAASQAGAQTPAFVTVTGHDFATSVRLRLTLTPGMVGPNAFMAQVTDYDTGRTVPATALTLAFTLQGRPDLGSPALSLTRGTDGQWTGRGTVISLDGTWTITARVQQPAGAVEVPLRFVPRLPPEHITVSSSPGQPTIYTISAPQGASVQTYVDPGTRGNNAVHFTFFQSNGDALPIASATGSAVTPAGVPQDLPLIRFDRGHFVANTTLEPGHWRFRITATTQAGTTISVYFEQHIPS